ncbi:MAG TPA: HAD-IB family phosphatase [Anaerolineae bacterium]|nr:HAD-IB family phosphatase [Anaerolineae bacterium]
MRWPPFQHIFFDCDSTLTTVEGIDVLAATANKQWRVEVLTNAAMNGQLDLADVYGKRLQAIHPTRKHIQAIRQVYKRNIVPDAAELIACLQYLGHNVYIISGGLAEPVTEFGIFLGVAKEQIRAVDVDYNELSTGWWESNKTDDLNARYMAYHEGALTVSNGKAKIVKELLGDQKGKALLIGDGSSDLLAGHAVDLFVGFGGVVARPRVQEESPVFLESASLAPLLALAAGPEGLRRVENTKFAALSNTAKQLIEQGAFSFKNERLNQKFQQAYQAIYPRTNGS